MFTVGTWVWIKDTDDHGKIENTGFTPADELYVRLDGGELTGPLLPEELLAHADYPHPPGALYDCEPCEMIMEQHEFGWMDLEGQDLEKED